MFFSANFNLGANKMKVDKLTGDEDFLEIRHTRDAKNRRR